MPVFSASSIPSRPLLSMWQPCQSVLVLWDMQVFLDSGPLYVSSCCFCVGFSHLSSFGDSFLFRLQLKQPHLRDTFSSLQFSNIIPFVVFLAAPPFCVSSFFRGVILCWNVSVWWAGTFLFSLASSAPRAELGFQRCTNHISKSINQSWISSDVKELTVECWVVGHLKIVITVSYFKSYCQLKNEKKIVWLVLRIFKNCIFFVKETFKSYFIYIPTHHSDPITGLFWSEIQTSDQGQEQGEASDMPEVRHWQAPCSPYLQTMSLYHLRAWPQHRSCILPFH